MATKKGIKSKTNTNSDLERLREAFNNSGGGSIRWWKPNWGDNLIRILPAIENGELFYLESARHRIDGVWYPCLRYKIDEETGKPCNCPACESRKRFFRTNDKTLVQVAKDLKGKLQYLMNIVERKGDDPKAVRVWGAGVKIWKRMVKSMLDNDLDITDVVDGYDFNVCKEEGPKTEKGTFPSYDTSEIKRKSTPLADEAKEINEILDNRVALDEITKFGTEEEMQAAIDAYVKALTDATTEEEFYEDERPEKEQTTEDKKPTSKKTEKAKLDAFKDKLRKKLKDE